MKKIIFIFTLFGCVLNSASAQLKLSLSILSDDETYLVSMVAEETIPTPLNTTSNIQVVLQVPDDEVFTAGNIQSLIPGITWQDNAYSDELNVGLSNLLVFNMVERSTAALPFFEGLETPLFTFKNVETECVGVLKLVENSDEAVQTAVANGYNYTQNFTVLKTRGNAFAGVLNGEVDCSNLGTSTNETVGIDQVNIYPIPAMSDLTVDWTNVNAADDLELNIISISGQKITQIQHNGTAGKNTIKVDLKDYSAGMYTLRFQSEENVSREYKFIVEEGK
jgi:hypothetical protein